MDVIDQRFLWLAGCQRTGAGRLRLRRPRSQGSGDGDRKGTQVPKGAGEGLLPRPMARCAQRRRPRAVDESTRQGHKARADGPSDGRTVVVGLSDAAQELGPAKQVVGQDCALEPGALAAKLPDGQCSMPAPSFRSRMSSAAWARSRWKASTSTALAVR